MGFGFDPSLILATQPATAVTNFADAFRQAQHMRLAQAQDARAQAEFDQQRQQMQSLGDIYRQNADNPQALGAALMRGGFGQQAFQAQDQAAQMAGLDAQRQKAAHEAMMQEARVVGQVMAPVKDQEGLTAAKAKLLQLGFPADHVAHIPDDWASAQKIMPQLTAFNVSPEKQAELGHQGAQLDETIRHNKATEANTIAAAKIRAAGKGAGGSAAPGSKADTFKEKVLSKLGKDLDPTQGRANLPAERQNMIAAAERLETLLDAPGTFTAQRLHEATMMAATIANGGHVPTETMVENMLPKTLQGRGAEFWQSNTSIPMDVGMKPFISLMRNQSLREKETGQKQLQQYLLGRLAKHPQAFQEFPEEANNMAEAAGLKGLYDPKTLRAIEGGGAGGPNHDAAAEWLANPANKSSPDYAAVKAAYDKAHAR